MQKSLRVLKLLWIFIDRVVFRCHSDSVLFRFFIDMILFRVLSDRVLFESSVIESSSGSAVMNSSLGSSVLFFRHVAIFFIRLCYYFIKSRCFVLHSLYSQKQFVWRVLITSTKLVRKNKWIEAVVQRCSVKKVFLEISQNSLENTVTKVSFFAKVTFSSGLRRY